MDTITNAYNSTKASLSTAPRNYAYLAWNAPGVEDIKPSEVETARKIGTTMQKMQQHNFDQHRHCFRATHVKTQAIVKGKLTVLADLPPHLQQGLFKTPGKIYNVAARYANEPVFLQADQEPGLRGLSLRVFGVSGERLAEADQDATTQDFFFNNAPMIELTDLPTCLDIMQLREKYFDCVRNEKVKSGDSREQLKDWLVEYFRSHGAKYELKIQLGTDPSHHPTEDGSVVWDEATAPYQTIATVEFPPQDALTAERRTFWEDRMKLNPWDALVEHHPLGSINRLRKTVYEMSARNRQAINAIETKRVSSVDGIP